jgi:flagellar motor component MotA
MNHSEFVKQCYKIVERALDCSQLARREGLLALEEDLSFEKLNERDIFEYGMRFAVDGTDPEIIRDILSNIIRQEKDEYMAKLKKIQLAAVLSIQAGDNPRVMYYRLNSFTDIPLNDEESKKILLSRGLL